MGKSALNSSLCDFSSISNWSETWKVDFILAFSPRKFWGFHIDHTSVPKNFRVYGFEHPPSPNLCASPSGGGGGSPPLDTHPVREDGVSSLPLYWLLGSYWWNIDHIDDIGVWVPSVGGEVGLLPWVPTLVGRMGFPPYLYICVINIDVILMKYRWT